MPFWRTYYHLIWATKNREHLITREVELELYPYLVAKATEHGIQTFAINGWFDHLHLLAAIPPSLSVADAVKNLKGSSAHMLNHLEHGEWFGWQRGYGVLTLGARQLAQAEAYVRGQKEHHAEGVVNPWLERVEDDDNDGDETRRMTVAQATIREATCRYEAESGDLGPF